MLRNKIDGIFARYDQTGSGFLEEHEFANFFGELCMELNIPPPQSYDDIINIAREIDTDYDCRISKM